MKALSKLMTLILRHEPARHGLSPDPEGFVPLEDLLAAVRRRIPETRREDLVRVVETVEPEKRRFTIEGDDIRANYGHSFERRVQHAASTPPPVLFHGTSRVSLPAIRESGLRPMRRQYVHLTVDVELARRVGGRHGPPAVLIVDARAAHSAGVRFYRANDAFWLADHVPPQYLTEEAPV